MLLLVKCFDIKKVLLTRRGQLILAPHGQQNNKKKLSYFEKFQDVMFQMSNSHFNVYTNFDFGEVYC